MTKKRKGRYKIAEITFLTCRIIKLKKNFQASQETTPREK